MRKRLSLLLTAAIILVMVLVAIVKPSRVPVVAQLTHQDRPAPRLPTLTVLPKFLDIPLYAPLLSDAQKDRLIQAFINHKVSTMPQTPPREVRVGKFTSTGIFGGFLPTEEQIARTAVNYDNILFGADRANLIPRFKSYNPDLTFFLYIDSGLNPDFEQADAGGVDNEDTQWIVTNHPDWLLRDAAGNPIRSGGGLSNPGEYWPDPGNLEWQKYFIEKITKLLEQTGGQWDGILFDQFIATADGHVRYAEAAQQVNYPTDEYFQAAYLEFFRAVTAGIPVPMIVNMEGASIVRQPEFVAEVANAAGGIENEIFPEEMPIEDLRPFLETIQNLDPTIHVRLNSKPSGFAGNIDDTLFAHYCYLLIAGKDRQVYWTYKEGTSDVPHYWYREFDLDLGNALGNIQFGEAIWNREFENAVVIVNAGDEAGEYTWEPGNRYYDVNGNGLASPVVLKGRTAMLLIKDPSILPGWAK